MSVHAKETHTFLIPDYYPQFSCKMGDCLKTVDFKSLFDSM